MADPDPQPDAAAAGVAAPAVDSPPWSQLWQVPALLLGLGLFAMGLWAVRPESVPNDIDAVLDDADRLILSAGVEDLDEAAEQLARASAAFTPGGTTDEQRGRYWQYSGDLVYLQEARGGDEADTGGANHALILADYERAEEKGRRLDLRSLRWRALTLVDLGRSDDALAAVDAFGPEAGRQRLEVLRELVRRREDAAGSAAEAAGDPVLGTLLTRYREEVAGLRDPADRRAEQRWLAATRARRLLAAGAFAPAVDYLSREVMQLRSAAGGGSGGEPELTLLLADAYRGLGNPTQAQRLYLEAQRRLDAADPLSGDTLLGLAALAEAEAADARERGAEADAGALARAAGLYAQVDAAFPEGPRSLAARLGAARVSAWRDPPTESLNAWRDAVRTLVDGTSPTDPRRDAAADELAAATDRALEAGRFDDALDLLEATAPLFGRGVPAALLLRQAETRERLAERRMAEGEAAAGAARAQAFRDAAAGFAAAATAFREHSSRLGTIDPEAASISLWRAARGFDRAERWTEAIASYDAYLRNAPDGTTRMEARHHLGLAHLASGEAEAAIDALGKLIDEHPTSRWSFASLVPLAQAELAAGRQEAALTTLRRTLEDNPAITPESPVYRDALITLGRTLYLRAREDPRLYPDAIARLEEAEQRFGEEERGVEVRYLLADALRRSIASLDREAVGTPPGEAEAQRPAAERLAVAAERARRLRRAGRLFATVRHTLEARAEETLTPLLRLCRRNAWFYEADCAYLAGDYAAAVPLYREAAERWSGDPAALVAQVQIVNAHCELGEFAAAGVANRRALLLLGRLDDAAFDSPDLPMDRRHWQDWLRWSSELDRFASATAAVEP
ncbi:tetratricopeptide repeat protein [Phycisphaera mikurensis]|uniref:Uncharacterized protein n=1 Tax=Phycisphaera mikurensis (strain NBRC 102666 / KCTC 22515 / FYK2301M01) TaxID=1142394 RepID=I0ICB3_PHYMF|nr:tetratricopeptide repeat protein [Phycisphaera mikurensis]MBB6441880.1 tetratricopeptide (TPR) repeat protein [Phycisphaera mikurensis]BAM02901.1 hypothetical protein PSMK_07420 [Phycisphaera mikurensis NBRC 102666]